MFLSSFSSNNERLVCFQEPCFFIRTNLENSMVFSRGEKGDKPCFFRVCLVPLRALQVVETAQNRQAGNEVGWQMRTIYSGKT